MIKKILITGAGGFLGGHLIESLAEENAEIRAIDLFVPGSHDNAGIEWIKCDLLKDDLTMIVKDVDVIYHLAGKYLPGNSKEILDELNILNVDGTRNIAKAASSAGVKKIIHISSIAACEESPERVIDEVNGKPITGYGFSKLESERTLISGLSGLTKYVIVRPVALFGENHKESVYDLVKAIKSRRFFLIGSGKNNVNFLYVKDLVNYLVKIGIDDDINNELFIVPGEPLQFRVFVDAIKRELGFGATKFYIPESVGLFIGYVFDRISKYSAIRSPLSFKQVKAMTKDVRYSNYKTYKYLGGYKYGVIQGLRAAVDWYKKSSLL
jgi:nucleoside-diphosphate-sugar epimerase